jgi:asparagine synthase (glutamine-hydrolysing)
MCGIAGIFDTHRNPTMADLKPMVDIQVHRGPDADGFLVDGPLAMGMRRLSIIDLAGGDQPIFSEDRSLSVVMNGELFNYIELQDWLRGRGHKFATKSDTEILVHLYEEHGRALLPKLNGMFAFALWDRKSRSLLLARDRMGVKPLYYARIGSRWLFGSELKALLTQKELNTELDLDGIADFLRLGYIPREATPYRAVRKLLPGHYLFIRDGHVENHAWWDLSAVPAKFNGNGASLESQLIAEFDDAVKLRMRSDVPVASFLSGGVDSSVVTITAQRQSSVPMRTFALGFEHSQFDERPYAAAVARQAGTDHREVSASVQDALEQLPMLLWHMDEPMGDSSIIPNYLISRSAAQEVKVCLSGLGGDELFGGYSRYLDPGAGKIRKMFQRAPRVAHALAPLVDRYKFAWGEELRLASSPSMAWRSYLHRLQIFDSRGLENIGFPARGHAEETVESLWRSYPGSDAISRCQFIDQQTYLPDQILALTDRMSMANSLEVRVPFMDYRLVRFTQRIPGALKQNSQDFKILLKNTLGKRCPPEILTRPKWGFDTPLSRWVQQPALYELIRGLPEGTAVKQGLFKAEAVRALVQDAPTAGRYARRVWNLFVLDVWLQIHRRPEPPVETLSNLSLAYAGALA